MYMNEHAYLLESAETIKGDARPNLVLEHGASKCPNRSEYKVEFVDLLGCVRGCVLRCEQSLQEVAQGLDHTAVRHRRDLLEPVAKVVQTGRNVPVKQDGQVGSFRLHFSSVNPALDVAAPGGYREDIDTSKQYQYRVILHC